MIKSFIAAFSTYSRIPMPKVRWEESDMKWSVAFFPLIGAVIGLLDLLVILILQKKLGFGNIFIAALLSAMPVLVTGGIHFDGFLDTSDALHSWQNRQEKLKILKDPNAGAFAVICGLIYQLMLFAFFTEFDPHDCMLLGTAYMYSRALSGLALVTLPKARKDGMLKAVADASAGGTKTAMIAWVLILAAVFVSLDPLKGGLTALAGAIVFVYYERKSRVVFGGITGDLAGWFVQLSEMAMLLVLVVCAKVI